MRVLIGNVLLTLWCFTVFSVGLMIFTWQEPPSVEIEVVLTKDQSRLVREKVCDIHPGDHTGDVRQVVNWCYRI